MYLIPIITISFSFANVYITAQSLLLLNRSEVSGGLDRLIRHLGDIKSQLFN